MKQLTTYLRIFDNCSLHRSLSTHGRDVLFKIALFGIQLRNLNKKPLNAARPSCSGLFCLGLLFNATHTYTLTVTLPYQDGLPKPYLKGELSSELKFGTGTSGNQEFFKGGLFSLGSLGFLQLFLSFLLFLEDGVLQVDVLGV